MIFFPCSRSSISKRPDRSTSTCCGRNWAASWPRWVMLAAAGLTIGRSFREWLAGFMIAFGVWDIFYYVFLKLLLDSPASLWTWDILFLLPVPWVGPVIAPVLVSLSMIVAGVVVLWRESLGRPVRCGRLHRALIVLGGLVVIAAFCWDFQNTTVGGLPNPFNWPLFTLGEAMAVAGFVHALRCRRDSSMTSRA